MRSILLILIIIGLLPIIFTKPHVGILVWDWLAFMNPHRLTWGATRDFQFAQIVGAVTLLAWLISREPKRIPMTPVTTIMLLFVLWTSVTTYFALVPDDAFEKWTDFLKIMLFVFITIPLINTKDRTNVLVWVIVCSIGFYGIKGGIYVIVTGGNWPVSGPPQSAIASNNALARALVMIIPLLRYLQLQSKSKWVVIGLWGAMALCTLSIFSTYSRGGILAFAAMALVFWLKSRRRFALGAMAAVILAVGLAAMPDKWYDRMASIQNFEQDWSSMDRIKMWNHGVLIAVDRPLVGGGFAIFPAGQFYPAYGLSICGPDAEVSDYCVLKPRASHNAYFDVLGEHGFVGLALFLALMIATLRTGTSVIRMARNREDLRWASDLASMLQVSIIGYAAGGLLANTTYFDLYYTLIAVMVVTFLLATKAVREQSVPKALEIPATGGAVGSPIQLRTDRLP